MKTSITFLLIGIACSALSLLSTHVFGQSDYDQACARFESHAISTAGMIQWYYVFPGHLPDLVSGPGSTANIETMKKLAGLREEFLLSEILGQEWNAAWENYSDEFYTYDQNDYLIEMLELEWNSTEWINSFRYDFTNNASGQPVEALMYAWEEAQQAWQVAVRITFTYNAQGDIVEMIMELWVDPVWMGFMKMIYTYSNGYVSEILTQSWDYMGLGWVNASRDVFTYDVSGYVIEELSQDWVNSSWLNSEKEELTYNGQGQHVESYTWQWLDNAWENYLHFTYTYTAHGDLSVEIEQTWYNGAWANNYKYEYTYDGNWNLSILLELMWDGDSWENSFKETYFYNLVGISEGAVSGEVFPFSAFPNPFRETLNMEYTLDTPEMVSVTLFDLSGKRLEVIRPETLMTSGKHYVNWTAPADLDNGIYLLDFRTGSQSRYYRVMKN